MNLCYLKLSSSARKEEFVRYYEKKGTQLKGFKKEEIPSGLEQLLLSGETAFLPFETSSQREEWKRVSEEVERLGIKMAFSPSTVIREFLDNPDAVPHDEISASSQEEGYLYLLCLFLPGKRKLMGPFFSPHKRITVRSPLTRVEKREERNVEEFVEKLCLTYQFAGFVMFRFNKKEGFIKPVEIDPLPDLSSHDKEPARIASAFGYSYESLLEQILKVLET